MRGGHFKCERMRRSSQIADKPKYSTTLKLAIYTRILCGSIMNYVGASVMDGVIDGQSSIHDIRSATIFKLVIWI